MGEDERTKVLLAQYREVYEYLRQHSRFMWQVHSLAVVISGGLIVASFAYIKEADLWWVRDAVLVIAGVVTTSLLLAMKKHRYFSDSEAWTLSSLEDALGTKRVQRTTRIKYDKPREDKSEPEYWNKQEPEGKGSKLEIFYAKRSADRWLGNSMLALLIVIFICFIFNTVLSLLDGKQILGLPNLLTAFCITIILFAIMGLVFNKLLKKV